MTEKDEKLLCDYIFNLLDESENKKVEKLLSSSPDHKDRYHQLQKTFGSLDVLKEEYISPFTRAGRFTFRFSAVAAVLMVTLMSFGFVNQASAGSSVSDNKKVHYSHSCKEYYYTPVSTFKCHGNCDEGVDLELDDFDPLTVSAVN